MKKTITITQLGTGLRLGFTTSETLLSEIPNQWVKRTIGHCFKAVPLTAYVGPSYFDFRQLHSPGPHNTIYEFRTDVDDGWGFYMNFYVDHDK